jgi:phage/plasmid primase-like uncharacterized protein
MKDSAQRDFERSFRRPKLKRCSVCGSPEGFSPEGKPVRMLNLGDGTWACNYCNNQAPGR